MKSKLHFLMVALLPFAAFGQNAQSKVSVYPVTHKQTVSPKSAASIATAPAAYCMPVLDCTDGDLITNVNFGGINNTTTCSPNGYGDFTAMQTTTPILAGMSYPLAVTVFNGSWPYEQVSAWVDYNKNDIFEASEYTAIGNKFTAGTVITGNISIPAGTVNGTYKMRVRVAAIGETSASGELACDEDQGYGETEDYSIVVGVAAPTGCLTAPNGVYPSATFTPNCNGNSVGISTACYAGEYSNVNVTMGTEYTFTLSKPGYFITIGNAGGTAVLGSGTGTLTWTSTVTGVVRFYSHTDSACGSGASETIHTRSVKCGTPAPPAVNCVDFKVLSNNLENGGFFGGETAQRLAIDLPIGSSAFTIYGIEPTVVGTATTFTFKIYSDNAGLPGTELGSRTGTILGSTVTGNNFGYDFNKYSVGFDTPIVFAANTKYWLEIVSDALAWESTTAATFGSKDVFRSNATTGWVVGLDDYVFNLLCNDLAVNDVKNNSVSVYPNPVKDILTITSKKSVENVQVYNVAGQKMQVSSKLVNGKLDMSKMAAGVYIISTILEDGTNESFKVIKK